MHVHNYHVSTLPASAALDCNFMYLHYTLLQYYCVHTVQGLGLGLGLGLLLLYGLRCMKPESRFGIPHLCLNLRACDSVKENGFSPVSAAPTVCVVLSLHRTLLCSVSGNDQHVRYKILCMCMCVRVCVHAWRCTVLCTPSIIPSVRCVPKYEELSGGAAQAQLLHNPGGVTEKEVGELQSHLCAEKRKEGTVLVHYRPIQRDYCNQ